MVGEVGEVGEDVEVEGGGGGAELLMGDVEEVAVVETEEGVMSVAAIGDMAGIKTDTHWYLFRRPGTLCLR